jgi:hypothetical protein
MRLAILTTDRRDLLRDYSAVKPSFGAAPDALLQGLAQLADVAAHVVSFLRQPARSPEKLAG